MGILTDLRAAWAAVDAARKTLAEPLPLSEVAYLEREEALYSALGTYHKLLTDDTIRALLDVAEAAQELCYGGTFSPRLQAAIAPLVKEASDE
jgi:hypothetical protein